MFKSGFIPLFYFTDVDDTSTRDCRQDNSTSCEPIAQESSLELVDVEFRPSGKRWLLRVYIDKEGGVTIADCERVSRELDRAARRGGCDRSPLCPGGLFPGLTRPLKKKEDFERYKGKMCRIVTTMRRSREERVQRGDRRSRRGRRGSEGEKGSLSESRCAAIKKANLEFEL